MQGTLVIWCTWYTCCNMPDAYYVERVAAVVVKLMWHWAVVDFVYLHKESPIMKWTLLLF